LGIKKLLTALGKLTECRKQLFLFRKNEKNSKKKCGKNTFFSVYAVADFQQKQAVNRSNAIKNMYFLWTICYNTRRIE